LARIDGSAERMTQRTEVKPISVTVKTAREMTGLGNTKLYELIKQAG
jgi:hypothetical protein